MTKRAFDLVLATLLVLLTLPIMIGASVGSALVLRSWPFFVQRRTGQDGRSFRFLKIRTLPTSTPAYLLKSELSVERLPAFTRVLRSLHFDELPQLFLVLAGRMSLVGPRPEMIEFHDRLDPDFAAARTSVLPGCTGLWQIGADANGLIGDSPEYDRFYLRHRSIRLDLWILAETARMMLGLGGMVKLAQVPGWVVPDPAPVMAPALGELELAEVD